MAQRKSQKDLLSRLSDAGEEALSRVASSPTTSRLLESVGGMRERLDDVQKRLRGLEALERRVEKLERRLDEMSKPKRAPASRSKPASTAKKTTASRPAASRTTTRKKPSS
jgi:biopolymer transport protein ExbB/TolQ